VLQAPIAFAMDTLALATPLGTTNIKMNNKRVLSTTFDVSSLIFARASTLASTPLSTPSRFSTSILGYGVLFSFNFGQINLQCRCRTQ
jgi:hypothetical protein